MLFAPKWLKSLNGFDKILNKMQIKGLELLRKKYGLPHELFCVGVAGSSEIGKIILRRDYHVLKKERSSLTEKEIFFILLQHENKHMQLSGSSEVMTDEQIESTLDEIKTFEDLCDFIESLENKEQPLFQANQVCQEIECIIKDNL
jgi:hypothetical protein